MRIGSLVKERHLGLSLESCGQIGLVKDIDSFQALILWCDGCVSFIGISELEVLCK